MAESRSLMLFKRLFHKLRKGFSVLSSRKLPPLKKAGFDEDMSIGKSAPHDVMERFFTVFAVKGKEMQRFVIELNQLTNPAFLFLLDQAREVCGFQQKGALSLPCQPHELQEILDHGKGK